VRGGGIVRWQLSPCSDRYWEGRPVTRLLSTPSIPSEFGGCGAELQAVLRAPIISDQEFSGGKAISRTNRIPVISIMIGGPSLLVLAWFRAVFLPELPQQPFLIWSPTPDPCDGDGVYKVHRLGH
jgi:hypothetical protein